ncbi:MAG: hypothetical protein WCG36_08350 [bacterium]
MLTSKTTLTATGFTLTLAAVVALTCLTACSKREPDKVPVKTGEKVAATNAPAPVSTQHVAKASDSNSLREARNRRNFPIAPKPASTPETKRALREQEREEAKFLIKKYLPIAEASYEGEMRDLAKKETEVREKDPVLKAAYGKVVEVNSAYEETCVKTIPGYDELLKDSIQLRDQLDAALAQPDAGQPGNRQAVGEIRRKLNHALSEISRMRTAANASDSSAGTAFVKVMTTQSEYQQALLKNDEYVQAKRKVDESASSIKDLTSRQ